MLARRDRLAREVSTQGLLVRFKNHVHINRPVDVVSSYVADFQNLPKWRGSVGAAEKEHDRLAQLGTEYRMVSSHVEQRFRITEHNLPRSVAIESVPGVVPMFKIRTVFLRRGKNRTLLSERWELDSRSNMLRARLLARQMQRNAAGDLRTLKERLEEPTETGG